MARFIIIAERVESGRLTQEAYEHNKTVPIFQRVRAELAAGAKYITLNTEPSEDPATLMAWGTKLIQKQFGNVPLALESDNIEAVEAGLKVYDSSIAKAIVNYADLGRHKDFLKLAAGYDAMCICRCSRGEIPENNDERMAVCTELLEEGLTLGMNNDDLLFNPVFLLTKGMQEKQEETLDAITLFHDMGLKTTGGLSKVADGAPKAIRSVICAAFAAMAMQCGLTTGILNPLDKRIMETVIASDMIKNNILYTDKILRDYLADEKNRFKTE